MRIAMAATFLSMTPSAWLPSVLDTLSISHNSSGRTLKGIIELGFVWTGVLIDTFFMSGLFSSLVLSRCGADVPPPSSLLENILLQTQLG